YSAGSGYNLVTGLGTPLANLVVQDLVAVSSTPGQTPGSGGGGGSGSPGGSGGGHAILGGDESGGTGSKPPEPMAPPAPTPTPAVPTVTDLSAEAAAAINLLATPTPVPAPVQAPTIFAPAPTGRDQVGAPLVPARQTFFAPSPFLSSGGDVSP